MVKEYLFEDRAALFKTLAQNCEQNLAAALAENNAASLMVSGGSTPAPLYEALSLSELDWSKISIALVDERWVDIDHEASNEALIKRTLLNNQSANATFHGMKTAAATAKAGCAETEAVYQQLPKPFTVTILGMGNDGHTASLFPHAEGLIAALDPANTQLTAAISARQSAVTGVNTERLSLSLYGLMQSQRLIILLTGEQKLEVFKNAQQAGSVADMPVRAILQQQQVPVELYWAP